MHATLAAITLHNLLHVAIFRLLVRRWSWILLAWSCLKCGHRLLNRCSDLVIYCGPQPHQAQNLDAHCCRTRQATPKSPFASLLESLKRDSWSSFRKWCTHKPLHSPFLYRCCLSRLRIIQLCALKDTLSDGCKRSSCREVKLKHVMCGKSSRYLMALAAFLAESISSPEGEPSYAITLYFRRTLPEKLTKQRSLLSVTFDRHMLVSYVHWS